MTSMSSFSSSSGSGREEKRGTRRRPRGSVALALGAGVAGVALVLMAMGRTWMEGRVAAREEGQRAAVAVMASGGEVTSVPGALALTGLAALIAVFAVRRSGRVVVSALLTFLGAGVVVATSLGVAGHEALDDAAATASGLTEATASDITRTFWPWGAALGGVLLLFSGLVTFVRGRDWPGMSSRYEAPGGGGRSRSIPVEAENTNDIWKALDRGEDPTDR